MRPYCLSNRAMVGLLHWRNNEPVSVKKNIATELALPLIAVAATVEGIFFTLLTIVTLFLVRISTKPIKLTSAFLMNAAGTITMTIANFLFYNFTAKANTTSFTGWLLTITVRP